MADKILIKQQPVVTLTRWKSLLFSIRVRIFKGNMSKSDNSVKPILLITFQYWYQNRRAKSRKEEANSASIRQTDLSNQFEPLESRLPMETWRPPRPQFPVSHARQEFLRVQSNRSDQLYQASSTSLAQSSALKSTQFSRCRSFQLPMFHPDQFEFRPVATAVKLPLRQAFHRYKPY